MIFYFQEVVNLLKKAVDVGDSEDFSIEEARKRMKEADKLDKELFRQKIKQRKLVSREHLYFYQNQDN